MENVGVEELKLLEEYMKYDCGFEKGNNWFTYCTGGILIHDNKMFFVKSAIGDYYYMIAGGVHLGETSESCIEREILEEAGIKASASYLAVVCENFFKGIGGKIDGFGWIYPEGESEYSERVAEKLKDKL